MDAKTAIVSGGSRGIGKAAVLRLLEDGFNVATFSRDGEKTGKLEKELEGKFGDGRFLVANADVAREEELAEAVGKTLEKFGRIDVLINNAGVGYFEDCDKVDMGGFQEMIQTNVVGVALLTRLVVPHMKRRKSGLIMNIASMAGKRAFANGEFYSATKFAVMGYSDGLRKELGEFGIKVSTVCPGMVKTDFFDERELRRRRKESGGKAPEMLETGDVARVISLICNQSGRSDIRDVTIMPF